MWRLMRAAVAFAIFVGVGAAADDQPKTPTKDGLWVLERHSNIFLFVAPLPKTPEAAAARSAEALSLPGRKLEMCLTADLRKKALEQPPVPAGCTVPPAKFENGKMSFEAVCDGKTYRSVFTIGPDKQVRSVHIDIISPGHPEEGGSVEGQIDPAHVTFTNVLNRQENGVHMTDILDYRWVAADCGSLKPGASRVVPLQGPK